MSAMSTADVEVKVDLISPKVQMDDMIFQEFIAKKNSSLPQTMMNGTDAAHGGAYSNSLW